MLEGAAAKPIHAGRRTHDTELMCNADLKRSTAHRRPHEAFMRRHIESNEQRDGRGVRQGNVVHGPVLDTSGAVIDPGAGIRIFVYLTAHSFDGYVFASQPVP